MSARVVITRRSFVAALGGTVSGLVLGVRFLDLGPRSHATAPPSPPADLEPDVFVRIAPDGTVSIVCHRSEMGQGIRSSLPFVLATELGADRSRVVVVQADGDKRYGDQNTDGSRSMRTGFERMRRAGATARTMLAAAAAQRWGLGDSSKLVARDHAVHDEDGGRTLGFGELAEAAAALPVPKAESVTLRPDFELERAGSPLPLLDGPAYVTGKAKYGGDVVLPDMLTAVVARPPAVGGKPRRVDEGAAMSVKGVRRVVTLPEWKAPAKFQPLGGVAVVADDTWSAMRGRAALAIEWEAGPNGDYDSQKYRAEIEAAVRERGKVVRHTGDADAALQAASRIVSAEYYVPHLAQAPMEPPVTIARVDESGCEVWAATQHPQAAREEVAHALDLDPSKVTVHVTFLGGGFGRKSKPDFVVEAALLAKAAGRPVRVQWTREDDIRHGYFHAVSAQRLEAAIDGAGKVSAWRHRVASPPIASTFDATAERLGESELGQGILDLPLAIPNVLVESCRAPAHVRIGWLRSVYNINHAFAVQSFIDELAAGTGRDPRELRLEILGPPRKVEPAELGVAKVPNYGAPLEEFPIDVGRMRAVVERVCERARWDERRGAGRALGLAAHYSFLTSVAAVASVTQDARGRIRVDEVWLSADCGRAVNPDRVRSQFEGAIVFGMSAAMLGAITAKGGAIEQTNFRDYPIVRMPEAPRAVHIDVVESDAPPAGVGEPAVPPIAPAIANAVFALIGKRIRSLPLRTAGM